ncbi:hypothetical protein AJ80_07461 [Polytolypa hystricis UAMH7299]|uniref:Major facilitator superfamily (MFS) profile domain-containing protein n=1 Tax=Polytolypa hystricis (strain UAMH7299) TaxID=1447883 RepID=A0A2B7XNV4_POLH7|nr:hypothetical protein AJ80_07461 [Polytolypa hystricis UAMH7299]
MKSTDDKVDAAQHDEEAHHEMERLDTKATDAPVAALAGQHVHDQEEGNPRVGYKVYKRRFFGLAQLVLLNVIVSWDWLSFSAVSTTASEYFDVSKTAINWLSTGFLFAFCVASPVVIYTLNKGGPKPSIITAAVLILLGNWIRYAGARASPPHGVFGVVMFGQILIGFAQPFILSAPTRYSDLWFTDHGRTSATAIATLANPFGGALGQLIGPMLATEKGEIPQMVLYIAIISTVASLPSFFIPSAPPTPPSSAYLTHRPPLSQSPLTLFRTLEFWLIFLPFSVYVGLFNSISSLLNQILEPHGFTETDAGICGAILIVVGLVSAAITSPLIDRLKHYLGTTKILVPIIAISYIAFVFAPLSRPSVVGPYIVAAILGASSFAVLPIILEYLVEITYPMSPEVSSTICWTGGQFLGAVFIIIENALKADDSKEIEPPKNMRNALVFQAVVASVVVPLPLCLGLFGRKVRKKRFEAETGRGVE